MMAGRRRPPNIGDEQINKTIRRKPKGNQLPSPTSPSILDIFSIYSGISPTVRLLSSLLPLYMYQVQMTAVSGIILIFLTFLREEDPEGSTNEAWLLEF